MVGFGGGSAPPGSPGSRGQSRGRVAGRNVQVSPTLDCLLAGEPGLGVQPHLRGPLLNPRVPPPCPGLDQLDVMGRGGRSWRLWAPQGAYWDGLAFCTIWGAPPVSAAPLPPCGCCLGPHPTKGQGREGCPLPAAPGLPARLTVHCTPDPQPGWPPGFLGGGRTGCGEGGPDEEAEIEGHVGSPLSRSFWESCWLCLTPHLYNICTL